MLIVGLFVMSHCDQMIRSASDRVQLSSLLLFRGYQNKLQCLSNTETVKPARIKGAADTKRDTCSPRYALDFTTRIFARSPAKHQQDFPKAFVAHRTAAKDDTIQAVEGNKIQILHRNGRCEHLNQREHRRPTFVHDATATTMDLQSTSTEQRCQRSSACISHPLSTLSRVDMPPHERQLPSAVESRRDLQLSPRCHPLGLDLSKNQSRDRPHTCNGVLAT